MSVQHRMSEWSNCDEDCSARGGVGDYLRSLPRAIRLLPEVWTVVLRTRPTLIHCHDALGFACAIPSKFLLRIPVVYHYHNDPRSLLNVLILKEANGLLFVGSSQKRRAEVRFAFVKGLSSKSTVVRGSISPPPTSEGQPLDEHQSFILQVDRVTPEKGQQTLIDASKLLVGDFPDLRVLIVGPVSDETYFRSLLARINADGLERNVHVTGLVSPQRLAQLYSECMIFVHPCTWEEPFGLVIVEAMAYSKAIVASDVGDIPDFLESGKAGTLVPPGDAIGLASALKDLLRDVDKRLLMGKRAYSRYLDYLSLSAQVTLLESAYHILVSRESGGLPVNSLKQTPVGND